MDSVDDHLSRIDTLWSMVRQAHAGSADETQAEAAIRQAQQELLDRYGGAVHRYALAALRSPEAADDVYQEFAVKFLSGSFHRADPERGRFRSLVKTAVYHLIIDYQRKKKRLSKESPFRTGMPEPQAQEEEQEHAELFSNSWRDELLARAWEALKQMEGETKKPYHTALRCRVDHAELRSPELAAKLEERLGKPVSAGSARVLIHRSRERFGELLLDEVVHSLPNATRDELEEELIDLNLFEYCRPILRKSEG